MLLVKFICFLSLGYLLFACLCLEKFHRDRKRARPGGVYRPAVTILKPVCGYTPELEDNLLSFCRQDYPEFQVIFGINNENDPALPVLERIIETLPDSDISLVVNPRLSGKNYKVSNLINMYPHARHGVLVIADDDIHVPANYLDEIVTPLIDPEVGVVTCLYSGEPKGGTLSSLHAMFINEWLVPSALVSRALKKNNFCFGATMVIRKNILAGIGGFETLADYLADDYMLGRLVADLGYKIHQSQLVVRNTIRQASLKAILLNEIRWARTMRAVEPLGYSFTFLTDTLVISLLAGIVLYIHTLQPAWPLAITGTALGLRLLLHYRVNAVLGCHDRCPVLLVPLRDLLTFFVRAASFTSNRIEWKSRVFSVDNAGCLSSSSGQPAQSSGVPDNTNPISVTAASGCHSTGELNNFMKKTLFLNPPSYNGFDGGAGSRYQCKREVKSFWYPTWLAQPAALVPGSRLIDAPARNLSLEDIVPLANDYELLILYTSTPSFQNDVRVAEAFRSANPELMIGFCGAHVAINPDHSVLASNAIDFIARNEFDFTIKEVAEGQPLSEIDGLTWKKDGVPVHNREREILHDMDQLPWVTKVYKDNLVPEDYYNGYMLHPYMSFYTGRGCKSRCTFCLWPQTIGGHKYRTRSVENIVAEVKWARDNFPQVKEFFFDDDTLTDNIPHVEALAKEIGKLGITWSCNAKANVPYETLKIMKDNGLRLLLVGYESGNQQILYNIKKGIRTDIARRFTRDCHKLGILIHGTFIVGLPGETRETIEESIRYAQELNPQTIQVSLPAAYPGTFLYRQALENGWLLNDETLVGQDGVQHSVLNYPHLSSNDIFKAVDDFYKRFYFRPLKMAALFLEMCRDREVMKRRLREGVEFFKFLFAREKTV